MATAQRLKKLTPTDVWSCKERLCLASSVMRSGDQNWVSVSRAIKPFGEPNRPADWFSQKNCALQYSELLEKVETPKRKRGERGENETPGESIVRNLTAERIEELKRLIQQDKQNYIRLKRLVEHVKSGAADDNLQELWDEILEEKAKKKVEEQKYHIWLQERENAKQAALAALKTVKIVPNAKKSSVKRLVLGRRNSSQSDHGSEPESNMESPLNEPLIVDNVTDDLLLSHDIVSNIPPFSSSTVPTLTPTTSCTSPIATSATCHHSPLLNNLLRSTSQTSTPSPSTISPTKEVSPRSQAALFSPTITSLLSATSNIPSLPTSVANLLTTALTGPPDSETTPPRPPVQSPSQGAPTLLKLLDMPLGIPGKLPPLPIITNPDPIPVTVALTLPPLPLSPAKLSSSTMTTTSTQAPIASVAVKLEYELTEPVVEPPVVSQPIAEISEGDLTMEVKMEVIEEVNVEAVETVIEEESIVVSEDLSVVEEVTIVEEATEVVEEVVGEVGDVVEVIEEVYVDMDKQVNDGASSEKTDDVGDVTCVKDEVIEVNTDVEEVKETIVVEEDKSPEKELVECVVVPTNDKVDDVVVTAVSSEDTATEEVAEVKTSPSPEEAEAPETETKTEIEAETTSTPQNDDKVEEVQEEVELLDVVKESKPEELIVVDDDVVSVGQQDYDSDQMTVINVESEETDTKVVEVEEEEEKPDKVDQPEPADVNVVEVIEEEGEVEVVEEEEVEEEEAVQKVVAASTDDDSKAEVQNEPIQSSSKEIICQVDSSDDEEDVPLLSLVKSGKAAILDICNKSNTSTTSLTDSPARSTRRGDGDKEKVKLESPQAKKLGPGKAWRKGLKGSASEAAAALKAAEDTGNEDDSDRASGKQESSSRVDEKSEMGSAVGKGKKLTRKRKEKDEKEVVVVPAPEVEAEVVVQKPTRRTKEEIPKAGGKHKTTLAISKGLPDIEISDDDERNSDREDSINARGTQSSGDELDLTRDYRVWKKAIMLVWRAVATHKYANVFLHPVTDEEAPGYEIVVNRPMDLQTIKRNIESGQIRTTAEFQRDVMLMCQNAIMYNSSDHDVYKMAIEMQKEVMVHIQDFLATQLMVQTTGVPLTLRRETREQTMKRSEISDKLPITPTLQAAPQERRASQIIARASFLTSDDIATTSTPRTRTSSSGTMADADAKETYIATRKRSFGHAEGGKVKKRRTRADD